MLTDIKVTKAKAGGYLQMKIDDQVVLMQEDNCLVNANQILKLSPLNQKQRARRIKALRDAGKVQNLPAQGTYGHMNAWIDICAGKALCDKIGLAKKLQPLLDYGLSLHTKDKNDTGSKRILPSDDNSLKVSVNRLTFVKGSEKSQSPFIELIYNARRLVIRRSDWKINCSHIANQMAGHSMMPKLLRGLPANAREVIKLSSKYTGTYVNFEYGIELFKTYKLSVLANQLLQLRSTEIERAAAPVLENPLDESYTVPVLPRPADSYHIQSPIIVGQSDPKGFLMLEDSIVTGNTRKSTSEGSEEDDDLCEEDNESSADTDITQLHAPRSDESDDEASSLQLNDTETNDDQRVEGRISYYSYGDLEPRDSGLKEMKLGLQTPSKTSSRYGNTTDVSCSFLLAASDG